MADDATPVLSTARQRARRAVAAEIAAEAMGLFLRQGFEQTTLEQIAAAVDMSSRTISRYFATKEDMVVGSLTEVGRDVQARLRERPLEESAWEAMRRALDGEVGAFDADDGTLLATADMLHDTPALRGAIARKHEDWEPDLLPLLTQRLDGAGPVREVQARAILGALLVCLTSAAEVWRISRAQDSMRQLMDQAVEAVRRA